MMFIKSMVIYTIITVIIFYFNNQYSFKNKKDMIKLLIIGIISFIIYFCIWNFL